MVRVRVVLISRSGLQELDDQQVARKCERVLKVVIVPEIIVHAILQAIPRPLEDRRIRTAAINNTKPGDGILF
jgi:hypothetical protein